MGPKEERLEIDDLLDSLVVNLETRGAKAIASVKSHLKPVREHLGMLRAVDLTATRVERFVHERLRDGKAPATTNREVGALKQALNLARKQGRLSRVPYIPMLREDNARQGFFERAESEAVVANLPGPIDDIARFAYLCGWRKGEILGLRWSAVDRSGGEIRLQTSKNGRGRVLPTDGEIADLIERRWKLREYVTPDGTSRLAEHVFHRQGRPIVDFRKAWKAACVAANVPGRLFHDFRRTAARDMVRSGTPEAVAMAITGHRTRSMFERYNITSAADMRAALRRADDYRETMPTKGNVASLKPRDEAQGS